MDEDLNYHKLKAVIVAGVVILVSAWKMVGETRYFFSGEWVQATVDATELRERTTRRYGRSTRLHVSFHYADAAAGVSGNGTVVVDPDSQWTPGHTFSVQFLPGVPNSARLGPDYFVITIFIAAVAAGAWFLYSLYREAQDPFPTSRTLKVSRKQRR